MTTKPRLQPLRKLLIALADDERSSLRALEEFTRKLGHFPVILEKNGPDLVKQCLEHPNLDMVITDVRMEGEYDGLEAIHRIQAAKLIPAIACTVSTNDRAFLNRWGESEHFFCIEPIPKPVSFETLQFQIEKVRKQYVKYMKMRSQLTTLEQAIDDKVIIGRAVEDKYEREGKSPRETYGEIRMAARERGISMGDYIRFTWPYLDPKKKK